MIIVNNKPVAFFREDGTIWLKHLSRTKLLGVLRLTRNKAKFIDCLNVILKSQNITSQKSQVTSQKLYEIRVGYERPRDCLPISLEDVMAFLTCHILQV